MIIRVPDVEYEPSVEVFNYKILKAQDENGNVTRHVVGDESYQSRVSTAIVEENIDYSTGEGIVVTKSGRVYAVKHPEWRISLHADYVWRGFLRVNKLKEVCTECSSDPHKMGCGSKYESEA